jgi:putative hydrolase
MLTNRDIAELMVREAEKQSDVLRKALKRAARLAFIWPREAGEVLAAKDSLTQFPGVGPHLERIIKGWVEKPPPVPDPEPIRANFLTLADARAVLRGREAWVKQLRGDLQMHSDWSDGSGTVREMAEAALPRGYEYIAITDHSKGLQIAGGIDEAALRRQAHEIVETNTWLENQGTALRVVQGLEMNINPSGEGDMDSAALAELDIVLGSFHSALRSKEDQTARYVAAIRNPDIQVLGHPRGRVYDYRLGLQADWPRVFAEAALLDKAVEIDCYPDRQDLSLDLLQHARAAGVRISIGTDAHAPEQLGFIELGLAAALLAKIQPQRIINFMPRDELLAWVQGVRSRRAETPRPLPLRTVRTPARSKRLASERKLTTATLPRARASRRAR